MSEQYETPKQFVNHYQVLRVPVNATHGEIEEAYATRLAQLTEVKSGRAGQQMNEEGMSVEEIEALSSRRLTALQEAYRVLSRTDNRVEYHRQFAAQLAKLTPVKPGAEPQPWVYADPKPVRFPSWNAAPERLDPRPAPFLSYKWERPTLPLFLVGLAAISFVFSTRMVVIPGLEVSNNLSIGALLLAAAYVLMFIFSSTTVLEMQLGKRGDGYRAVIGIAIGLVMGTVFTFTAPTSISWSASCLLSMAAPLIATQLFKLRQTVRPGNSFSLMHSIVDFVVMVAVVFVSFSVLPDLALATWLSVWAFLAFIFRM